MVCMTIAALEAGQSELLADEVTQKQSLAVDMSTASEPTIIIFITIR
ncbi:Uncharacterised protein [Serratia quinivorans]|nr:Uncharacterised protein [Serratia quinivorans]